MPRIDWSKASIVPVREKHPQFETQLNLKLNASLRVELVQALRELLASPGTELRLELPTQWTLYWKAREGESRLLLAHPEKDAWVGTLAVTAEHGQALIAALEQLGAGRDEFRVSELGSVSRLGNFELLLSLAEG